MCLTVISSHCFAASPAKDAWGQQSHAEIRCHVIATQQRETAEQCARELCNVTLQTELWWANCKLIGASYQNQGRVHGWAIGAIAPPKSYENKFVHHNFVQFGKQHSRYKAILSPTVLSQLCCEVHFILLTVAKLLWNFTKYSWNRPP